jgi:hypothetical protein
MSSRTMALESTQSLTEISTRNLSRGKGRPECKADNLTAICEPIVYTILEREPRRLTTLWASTACYMGSFYFFLPMIMSLLLLLIETFRSAKFCCGYCVWVSQVFGIGNCRNGKKGIRLCQEDFTCDLKWQWDCDKSVARIRLVKAENPNVCVTNWKVCRILPVVPSCECIRFNKSNHPIQNPTYISHPYAWQYAEICHGMCWVGKLVCIVFEPIISKPKTQLCVSILIASLRTCHSLCGLGSIPGQVM